MRLGPQESCYAGLRQGDPCGLAQLAAVVTTFPTVAIFVVMRIASSGHILPVAYCSGGRHLTQPGSSTDL